MPNWIAKPCLDIGLYTNQLDPMLEFWQRDVGLKFDHMLPVGGGVRQHRHLFETAVLKLNHTRETLGPASRGGYRRLIIGLENVTETRDLTDPDGNAIRMVPKGAGGIDHWAIEVATESANRFFDHYERSLGLPRDEDFPIAVRCGRSLIMGVIDPEEAHETNGEQIKRTGIRYTTIQVSQVDTVHNNAVAAGACEGIPPQPLGKVARISFLQDPHGNWMELSQRASITGSLAPN